jgi:hypothetical protein
MIPRVSWTKARKIGFAGLAAVIVGWLMFLYIQTLASVCGPSARLLSWPLFPISLASPIALLWAAVKDKWWWSIGLIPAILLLLAVLGTFEGC